MAKESTIPRFRVFNGKRYERVGSDPGTKREYEQWADFNRKVNKNRVRVVQVSPGKWLAYINYPSRAERKSPRWKR